MVLLLLLASSWPPFLIWRTGVRRRVVGVHLLRGRHARRVRAQRHKPRAGQVRPSPSAPLYGPALRTRTFLAARSTTLEPAPAVRRCSSTTLIDAGCSVAGDPPDRPNYGTTFATSASEASPPSVTAIA